MADAKQYHFSARWPGLSVTYKETQVRFRDGRLTTTDEQLAIQLRNTRGVTELTQILEGANKQRTPGAEPSAGIEEFDAFLEKCIALGVLTRVKRNYMYDGASLGTKPASVRALFETQPQIADAIKSAVIAAENDA